MTAIQKIHDEHRSIAAVLHALKSLARDAQDARVKPRFEVFHAMLHYIDQYPERLHHPKEDRYLFLALRKRTGEANAALDRLEQQHQQGAEMIRHIEQALLRYEQGGAQFFEAFASRASEYADFHWRHMREEEDAILPLAERVLTAEDWEVIDNAFAGNDDPLLGIEPRRDYERLFTRIVMLVPPPIGIGPSDACAS